VPRRFLLPVAGTVAIEHSRDSCDLEKARVRADVVSRPTLARPFLRTGHIAVARPAESGPIRATGVLTPKSNHPACSTWSRHVPTSAQYSDNSGQSTVACGQCQRAL
jgi:hypothetical protein